MCVISLPDVLWVQCVTRWPGQGARFIPQTAGPDNAGLVEADLARRRREPHNHLFWQEFCPIHGYYPEDP